LLIIHLILQLKLYTHIHSKVILMKKTILYAFLLLTLSCGNSDNGGSVLDLEKLHQDKPTADTKKQLAAAYQNFIANNPDDKAKCATYSHQLAKLQMDLNQYPEAANTLTGAIKNFATGGNTSDYVQMISSLFMNRIYPNNPKEAYSKFAALFPDQASMKTQITTIIENLKNTMLNTSTSKWDRVKVNDYISLSRLYGGIMPKDANSTNYLYKAAEIANALGNLFLKAYTLDDYFKKYDEAKALYEKVVADYPESKFAESAKASINFLGKSPEEILKSFEKGK